MSNKPNSKSSPKPHKISFLESVVLLERMPQMSQVAHFDWDREKQKIHGNDETGARMFTVRLPLPFYLPEAGESIQDYSTRIRSGLNHTPPPYLMILMQAGHAALGYFEEGEVVHHKVVKKYMVRRKQGKSQVGYLGTRGKSKAGSRVRLANAVRFF
ncbi:MAG: hypothetical protein AAF570_03495, partial [Bacteroidota bacterium]